MYRFKGRLWLALVAVMVVATMIASCAPSVAPTEASVAEPTEEPTQPTEKPAEPAEEPVTISVWHWKFGQTAFKEWSDWVKETFEADHPNVTLDYYQPADLGPEVQAAVAVKEGVPDVVGMGGNSWEAPAVEAGIFLDIGSAIDADPEWQEWTAGWSSVPEAQYIYNGMVFVVNLSNGPNFIYYRKDLFEEAGVEPPETIEDLLALPPAFEAIGVDTMVSGLDSTTLWQYVPWFYSIAGAIDYGWALDRQADECQTWTGDSVAEEALLTFERLYDEGVLRQQTPQEKYDPDAKQAFIQGKVAMQYTAGVWLNGGLADNIDNIGALYFPALNAGDNRVLMGSNDVAVSILNVTDEQKDPAHQDLVLEFAKFISSPESQAMIWEVGLMPLMPEAITSEDTSAQRLVADQVRMAAAPDVNVLYYAPQIPEVGQVLGEGMLGMLIDVKTVDEVLADIDAVCAAR